MNNNKIGVAGTVVSNASGIILMAQTIDIMSILVMLIGIISGGLSIGFSIYNWYKKVTREDSDGGKEITLDEVKDGIDKIIEKFDKENKNGNNNRG